MFSPPLKKSIVFLKYALKMDLVKGEWFDLYFERMYQCDQSRSAKGNGLGLAIAKELISVHKGTITAENSSDKGTVFTILLPKAL